MSTKTLVESVIKTPEAPETQAPAKILPAKAALTKVWTEYQRAASDLEEARGHLARAEADEQAALNDESLSDAENSDKVAFCQRSKGIYSSRVANREAAKKKLLADLKAVLLAAHSEFSNLLGIEHSRRHDELSRRVIIAGRLIENHFLPRRMDALLGHSELIDAVRRAEIPHQAILISDGADQLEGLCRRILAGYELVASFGRQDL